MTVRLPDALYFPSKEKIISHLENHTLTNGCDPLYLKKPEMHLNKRIIEVVAQTFANQYSTTEGLKKRVWFAMQSLNKELELPSIIQITLNLTWALYQCAQVEPGIRPWQKSFQTKIN
jgi:hypothetical protein